jgi:hypothetical protein
MEIFCEEEILSYLFTYVVSLGMFVETLPQGSSSPSGIRCRVISRDLLTFGEHATPPFSG